ncbi:hypothetical protein E3P86_01026 [Wallemia ichthyophaga]|uniref:Deoxycytidylate deaminase n=1 Tax=Wallemia ichthyophaga TaxID=245174 RepID=A0A4T0J9M1_WALIC|nr:hypothetical protein E3P86_01026 [Wallemia ichthyophaga]
MFIALVSLDKNTVQWTLQYLSREHNFTQLELESQVPKERGGQRFDTHTQMIEYATQHWQSNLVTTSLHSCTCSDVDTFLRRPFTLLVALESSIENIKKSLTQQLPPSTPALDLAAFLRWFDGAYRAQRDTLSRAQLNIYNGHETEDAFVDVLREANIVDEQRIRPSWDTYFMELADLASQRSNCMKRRVGAVLTQDKRVVSTGYNGTPKGLLNCADGGCKRCNSGVEMGFAECLCLHAEENALLEAGRGRIGECAVLYCNTCPCLGCAVKIVQTGISQVVYNHGYRVDQKTLELFRNAGVVLRHTPMKRRAPSDKSTTDEECDDSDEIAQNQDQDDNSSQATLSESDLAPAEGGGDHSGSGIKSSTIKTASIPLNSPSLNQLATSLGLLITHSDIDVNDVIVKSECLPNKHKQQHAHPSVCHHWLRDSAAAGRILPIALYVLDDYNPNNSEDGSDDLPPNPQSKNACFRIHPLNSPNEHLVHALRILKQDRVARDERWNALAYSRAAAMVKSFPHRIRSKDDIRLQLSYDSNDTVHTKNIGEKKIRAKIEEYLNYGRISEAETIQNSPSHKLYNALCSIQGIGPRRAYELSRTGASSLGELVERGSITQEDVTLAQHLELGIPRTEVSSIAGVVMENARTLLPHPTHAICGGYRRGKSESNDIDILITHHGYTLQQMNEFLANLARRLQDMGFLTKLMRQLSLSDGHSDKHDYQSTLLGVVASSSKYGTTDSAQVTFRRVDIIVCHPHSFHLEVLAWTGSVMYERDLRAFVKRRNLKLNASSVYNEHTNNEVDLSGIRSERHLLAFLHLPWIAPENRNCD